MPASEELMIVGIAVSGLFIFGAWVAHLVGMPRLNALSAFAASWVTMILVATAVGGVTDEINGFTWTIILSGWGALLVGSFLAWGLRRRRSAPRAAHRISLRRTIFFHWTFSALFAIYVTIQLVNALPLIEAAGGWQAILSTGANGYRAASLQQSLEQSQNAISEGVLTSVINYATFIPGTLATYTGAVLWRSGRRILALMPVLLGGALGLLTMQRTSIVLILLLFVIGVWLIGLTKIELVEPAPTGVGRQRREATGFARFRAAAATLLFLGLAAWFLFVTTQARSTQEQGGTVQSAIGEYVVGGIAGMNARSAHGSSWPLIPSDTSGVFDPSPGMGGYTFTGLWTVLARLGVPVETTRVNLDFVEVSLFGESTITNVVSAFGEFYLDFRLPGVIGLCFLLGLLTTALQARLIDSRRITLVPAVAYLLTFTFWSFFVAWSSDLRQLLIAAIGGIVLTWAVRERGAASPLTPSVAADDALTPRGALR